MIGKSGSRDSGVVFRRLELRNEYQKFGTLEVWKKAKDFALRVYREVLPLLINGYVGYLKPSKQCQNEPGVNPAIREDTSSYNLESSDVPTDDSEFPNPE